MNFNRVIFGGRLTRDPTLKYLPSQMAVTEFGLVSNRKYKTKAGEEREDATFLDCVAWGKTGELINQHFQKGKTILVEGSLRYETWEKDGQKRSTIKLTVDSFQFVGSKSDGASGDAPSGDRQTARRTTGPAPEQKFDDPAFDPDSIPF